MKEQIFSRDFHKKLQRNVEKSFKEFIADLRFDFQKGFDTDEVDPDFLDQLNDIVHDEAFNTCSPLKFYWLNLVDNLIYAIQLHEELLTDEDLDTDELSEVEEELFTFWNDSELAESFLNFVNEGAPVIEASQNLIPLLENQIISFYVLHLNLYRQEFGEALMYQIVSELGDSERRIYITDNHLPVNLKKSPSTYPSLPLTSVSPEENILMMEVENKSIELKIEEKLAPIRSGDLNLYLLPQCDLGDKLSEKFKKDISLALDRIGKAAPHLLDTFRSYTHTIVPVNEKGIVSYSMQSLPGYSCINLFDRDKIDLMDDLLHENGHHYLNTFLNHTELINEDDEKIYYSPWRKALRPIRGIYHATFTFFWALELFFNLNDAIKNKKIDFNKIETIKIKKRFLEEFFMLNYCREDLLHAFKNKKVTKEGHELILMVYGRIDVYKKSLDNVLKDLKALDNTAYDEILKLRDDLNKTRAHYKLV